MSESECHINLVTAIEHWVKITIVPKTKGVILKDTASASPAERPPSIYGYIPDIYYRAIDGGFVLIGEAKTRADLNSNHTIVQLEAFCRHCKDKGDALLVLAVPWDMVRFAKSILTMVKRRIQAQNVKAVILEKLI